jgi:hypothetical protein
MPPQYVVDSSHVFHLLAEGADALELTGRGSKRILVFGHGLGCRHELTSTVVMAWSSTWLTVRCSTFFSAWANAMPLNKSKEAHKA